MKKTIVITGANSGIGLAATRHFASGGVRVVMACRSASKAEAARSEVLAQTPKADVIVMALDVSNLDSIRAFSQLFGSQVGQWDVLINNAGIVALPLTRNGHGHEMQMATNYLGAFALSGLLLPHANMDEESPARIVNVNSLAHRFGELSVENLNWRAEEYNEWKAYANGKLALMNHTLELNRRLQSLGRNVIALSAHPGFANTNIHKGNVSFEQTGALRKWLRKQGEKIVPDAQDAVRPIIMAAESNPVLGGDYYGPGGFLEIGGKPDKARINKKAHEEAVTGKLWAESERLAGVSYLS
ncbi:SDR family NAD(P)-dependent oxidoreductase [Halioxenophilus aromaticivorans]|uniref:Oxidoreductase n=1 Tax=Halioxenophilus aromaticivorans TaxID=1306992 RepID=A0AAV3U3M3_9ALTE